MWCAHTVCCANAELQLADGATLYAKRCCKQVRLQQPPLVLLPSPDTLRAAMDQELP